MRILLILVCMSLTACGNDPRVSDGVLVCYDSGVLSVEADVKVRDSSMLDISDMEGRVLGDGVLSCTLFRK